MYEAHCRALAKSFRNYNESNVRGKVTVYFFSTVHPKVPAYAIAAHDVYIMKLRKDGCFIVILDGHHWYHPYKIIGDKDSMNLTTELLRMGYASDIGSRPIFSAKAIKLNKIANI